MKYNNLGRTGLKVSELCMGTMQFGWTADENIAYQILDASYDAGINFIDTADVYSRWVEGNSGGVAETIIGRWLEQSSIPRDQVIVATKVRATVGEGPNDQGLSRGHIMDAVEASLRRLNTDYIDLYQSHAFDPASPIEETLRAFDDLIRQGKVRYIGCSNYPAWRLMQSLWVSDKLRLARYDVIQPHFSLVHRDEFERELADVCRKYGIGVIPYSPLGGGFLTGKYRKDHTPDSARMRGTSRYFNDKNWTLLDIMEAIAKEKGGTISQIALAWQLADPLITSPIIGPRSMEQLQDNLRSVELELSESDIDTLNKASEWKVT